MPNLTKGIRNDMYRNIGISHGLHWYVYYFLRIRCRDCTATLAVEVDVYLPAPTLFLRSYLIFSSEERTSSWYVSPSIKRNKYLASSITLLRSNSKLMPG